MEIAGKYKLIICVRHGERSDFAGLTPKLHPLDPELTTRGEEQGYEIGKIIKKHVTEKYNLKSESILLLSSPFSRTLQTSKQMLRAFNETENEDNINLVITVDNTLSERIDEKFNNERPVDFLSLYHDSEVLKQELQTVKIEFINSKEFLPTVENSESCFERMKKSVENIIENYLNKNEISAVILVSHYYPIDALNHILGYPGPFEYKYISYCGTYIYSLNLENKNVTYLEQLNLNKSD